MGTWTDAWGGHGKRGKVKGKNGTMKSEGKRNVFARHRNKTLSYGMRVLFFLLEEMFESLVEEDKAELIRKKKSEEREECEECEDYGELVEAFEMLFFSYMVSRTDLVKKMLLSTLCRLRPFVILAVAMTERGLQMAGVEDSTAMEEAPE
ncbi:uncharacterized protein MONOS_13427p1 [Monocercomonoides exilis]|nr:hypothetical protein MONOS_13427p1 [Monocercomonoides exilis]